MVGQIARLNAQQKSQLLSLARGTAGSVLSGREPSEPVSPIVGTFGGAFVTFWDGRKLRGCVGSLAGTDDICELVSRVTRSSLADPRFRDEPIGEEELPSLTIEVSLVSEPFPAFVPADLICGLHGVIVRRGERSGCFLPKVATERNWSAEELLSNCCTMKAGLPADAWRDPVTEVLLFTADSFRDHGASE